MDTLTSSEKRMMIQNIIPSTIIFILGLALWYCILIYHEEKEIEKK